MKAIDIHGMTNMELVRGETDEWYWATDYIHGDLYEAEELFRQGHPVRSNRLYLIHYPDGTVYEAVSSTNRSHFDSDLCFLPPFARRIFRCFHPLISKLYPRKWTRDFDPWSRSADTHLTHRVRSAAPVL